MSWIVMFGLFLAIFPTVIVLLGLLHQKGLFDPLHDCWEDNCWTDIDIMRNIQRCGAHIHHHHRHTHANKHNQRHGMRRHHKSSDHHRRKSIHNDHRQNNFEGGS